MVEIFIAKLLCSYEIHLPDGCVIVISYRLRIVDIERGKVSLSGVFFLVSVLADFDDTHTIILVILYCSAIFF